MILDAILDWGTIDYDRSGLGDTRSMVNLKWVRATEAWNNRQIRSHEIVKHEAQLLNEKGSCHSKQNSKLLLTPVPTEIFLDDETLQ